MAKVVVVNHVTFDGVMQVPGAPMRTHLASSRTATGRSGATMR